MLQHQIGIQMISLFTTDRQLFQSVFTFRSEHRFSTVNRYECRLLTLLDQYISRASIHPHPIIQSRVVRSYYSLILEYERRRVHPHEFCEQIIHLQGTLSSDQVDNFLC